ncbi:hypothetical protein BST61_g3314 [Cercospora zeina]
MTPGHVTVNLPFDIRSDRLLPPVREEAQTYIAQRYRLQYSETGSPGIKIHPLSATATQFLRASPSTFRLDSPTT